MSQTKRQCARKKFGHRSDIKREGHQIKQQLRRLFRRQATKASSFPQHIGAFYQAKIWHPQLDNAVTCLSEQ